MVRLDPDKEFMIVSGDRRHRSDLTAGTFVLMEGDQTLLEGSTRWRTSGDPEYPTPGDRLTLTIDMQDPEGRKTALDTTAGRRENKPGTAPKRFGGAARPPFRVLLASLCEIKYIA